MTCGGNNLHDFPDNRLTKFRAVYTVKVNRIGYIVKPWNVKKSLKSIKKILHGWKVSVSYCYYSSNIGWTFVIVYPNPNIGDVSPCPTGIDAPGRMSVMRRIFDIAALLAQSLFIH